MSKTSRRLRSIFIHVFLLIVGINPAAIAQKVIDLMDYGMKPNSFGNASPAIARALHDAAQLGNDSCIVRFPKGRIDLWPDGAGRREYFISNATEKDQKPKVKTVGMILEHASNITLEGNGALLVYHGKMMLMAIDQCSNIKIEGLQFDFERPTMSEMEIAYASNDTVVANIHPDSRYTIENMNGHDELTWYGEGWKTHNAHVVRYVPQTQAMYYGSWKPFAASNATELSPYKVRFTGNFTGRKFEQGDILTIRDPYRDAVGVFNNRSHQVVFKNLDFYYMHGLGIVNQLAEDITLDHVRVAPRPGSGRVIAAFADCFHFSGCYGNIKIENCLTSGSHDDPVNIHGTHLRIVKSASNNLTVRFMHHQTWGFEAFDAYDTIGFVDNKNLLVEGTAVVRSAKMLSDKDIALVLDRPVPAFVEEGYCVENITKTPAVTIRNNRFEHTNTRGLLVTTRRKVLIEGNTFFKTGMHAILIADDANSWYESGPVKDVTIRNNKFIDCAYNSAPDDYVIAIKPEAHQLEKKRYVHSNIRIVGNEFQVYDSPLVFARSVDGLGFSDNDIVQKRLDGFPFDGKPMFDLEHCAKVKIEQNQFSGEGFRKEVQLRGMRPSNVQFAPKKAFQVIH